MILEVSFFTSVKTVRKNCWERRIKRRRLAFVASFLRAIREERGIHVVRENHRPVEPQDRQNDVVAILLVHHHLLLGVDPDVAGVETDALYELLKSYRGPWYSARKGGYAIFTCTGSPS